MAWLDAIDPPAAVRGMSTGFTVLVIGGIAAPLAAATVPVVGSASLVVVAVLGFAVAAWRQGTASGPIQQGVTAAVGAYLLVLPLVGMGTHHWDPVQIAVTLAVAIVVGAAVGPVSARRSRARRAAAAPAPAAAKQRAATTARPVAPARRTSAKRPATKATNQRRTNQRPKARSAR